MRCLILCFIFYAGGMFEGGNMFVLGGIYGLNYIKCAFSFCCVFFGSRARAVQADVEQIVMCLAGVTCGGNLGEKVGDARTQVLFSFVTV